MFCTEGLAFGPEALSDFFPVFLDFWLDSFVSGTSPRKMLCSFYGIHNKLKFFQGLIILLSLYARVSFCVISVPSGCTLLSGAGFWSLHINTTCHLGNRDNLWSSAANDFPEDTKPVLVRHLVCHMQTSMYVVGNEELRDSTRCKLCEGSEGSMFLCLVSDTEPASGKDQPLLLSSDSTHLSVSL